MNPTRKEARDERQRSGIDRRVSRERAELEAYTDSGDSSTLSSARSYADSRDSSTLSSANSYTDSRVRVLAADRYNQGAPPSTYLRTAPIIQMVSSSATAWPESNGTVWTYTPHPNLNTGRIRQYFYGFNGSSFYIRGGLNDDTWTAWRAANTTAT